MNQQQLIAELQELLDMLNNDQQSAHYRCGYVSTGLKQLIEQLKQDPPPQ